MPCLRTLVLAIFLGAEPREGGWRSLFGGTDLAGWTSAGGFVVEGAPMSKRPTLEAPRASAGPSLSGSIALSQWRNAPLRPSYPFYERHFLKLFLPIVLGHEFHD